MSVLCRKVRGILSLIYFSSSFFNTCFLPTVCAIFCFKSNSYFPSTCLWNCIWQSNPFFRPSAWFPLLWNICGTCMPRLFRFLRLLIYQLVFSRPSACLPFLGRTRIPRPFRFWILLNYQLSLSRTSACLPFIVELVFPVHVLVKVYLIIKLLLSNSLRDFLFNVELAFPGYLSFGD